MSLDFSLEKRHIATDQTSAQKLALEWWKEHTQKAFTRQGFVNWALSGGKTPKGLYEALSQQTDLPWDKIRVFLVDERDVDETSDQSNLRLIRQSGISLRLPEKHILGMRNEPFVNSPSHEYEQQLLKHCPQGELDLVLLGMGSDGHTASLFPDTPAGQTLDPHVLVVTHSVPSMGQTWRRSLSFECLLRARHVVFYVLGNDKQACLKDVWNNQNSTLPAALLRRWRLERGRSVDWIVDAPAAGVIL